MAKTKSCKWWLNSGATIHVCNDKKLFLSYKVEKEGQIVLMGSNDIVIFVGKGIVETNFTSGEKVTLSNILDVPSIRKNLVSAMYIKMGLRL